MKTHPSSTKEGPAEDLSHPNDDGCVLGTAGRDEDPNSTTDWDRKSDSAGDRQTPDDAHGMPGYPRDPADDQSRPATKPRPDSSESEPGIETPEQGNDKAG